VNMALTLGMVVRRAPQRHINKQDLRQETSSKEVEESLDPVETDISVSTATWHVSPVSSDSGKPEHSKVLTQQQRRVHHTSLRKNERTGHGLNTG
jgi:hypothetical protein